LPVVLKTVACNQTEEEPAAIKYWQLLIQHKGLQEDYRIVKLELQACRENESQFQARLEESSDATVEMIQKLKEKKEVLAVKQQAIVEANRQFMEL